MATPPPQPAAADPPAPVSVSGTDVGRRIRRAREERGLSQAELGEALGYKASMVSAFENGTRRLKLEDLTRVCVVLGKEPEFFLRTRAVREQSPHRVGLTLRAQLADLHHQPLTDAITSFLDAVECEPLPDSDVPDLHYLKPHGAARELRDRCRISGPRVELEDIAAALRVPLIPRRFPDSLSALIVEVGEGDYVVGVNRDHPDNRKRFSVAHEIGHAVLRHRAGYYLEFFNAEVGEPPNYRPADEREANAFAAALLMDERWLREDWAAGRRNVQELANRYQVSQEAMSFRLVNLGLV